MDKKITKKEIKHIAKLAHIRLEEKEIQKYQKQLKDIINYFDKLSEVDTKGIKPIDQVTGIYNRLRKDEFRMFLNQKDALKNASSKENGFFKTLPPL